MNLVPPANYKVLGEALKQAREAAGVTAAELAQRVGVQELAVRRWQSGDRKLDLEMLVRVEDALGLSRGQLLRSAGFVAEPGCVLDLSGLRPNRKRLLRAIMQEWGDIPSRGDDDPEDVP